MRATCERQPGGSKRRPCGEHDGRLRWVPAVAFVLLLAPAACQRVGPPPEPPAPLPEVSPELADWARDDAGDDLAELPPPPQPETEEEALRDPLLFSAWAAAPSLEERTRSWIHFWQTRGRDHFGRYLERKGQYQDMVDRALEERGLPPSLRYLPIVESGYHPTVVSRVGATGMWQLMPGTARDLDVYIDPLVDERRDPEVATRAALDYLEELHARFDSWFLALAAYNAGPARVAGILDRQGGNAEPSDSLYVALRAHFPDETAEFVPRFFAAARIARDPEAFGFGDVQPGLPLEYEVVTIPDAASLDVLAEAAGMGEDELALLNPQLQRRLTPGGRETGLRVPPGRAPVLQARLAQIPREEWVSFTEHRIASGETLTHVARTYGVPLSELQAANPGIDPRRLQIGQRLVVPTPGTGRAVASAEVAAAGGAESPESAEGDGGETRTVTHVVRSGESLWSISRDYGVPMADLRRWNGLPEEPSLRPGDRIEVQGVTEAVHRVRSGETLSAIASRYGLSPSELARSNGISLDAVIRPGQELRVPVQAACQEVATATC